MKEILMFVDFLFLIFSFVVPCFDGEVIKSETMLFHVMSKGLFFFQSPTRHYSCSEWFMTLNGNNPSPLMFYDHNPFSSSSFS